LSIKKGNVQVNIIVATSILEEGLDVQSCNLVIRFDPSPTVCSFIQSRGRARMRNSDYILIVKRYLFPTLLPPQYQYYSGNMEETIIASILYTSLIETNYPQTILILF